MFIRPEHNRTAIATFNGIGRDHTIAGNIVIAGVAEIRIPALPATTNTNTTTTSLPVGIQLRTVKNGLFCSDGNFTTLPLITANVECATDIDIVTGSETNNTAIINKTRCFYSATIIDHTTLQAIGGLSRHNNKPAWCMHGVTIFYQHLYSASLDTNIGQGIVTAKLQFITLASGQRYRT